MRHGVGIAGAEGPSIVHSAINEFSRSGNFETNFDVAHDTLRLVASDVDLVVSSVAEDRGLPLLPMHTMHTIAKKRVVTATIR